MKMTIGIDVLEPKIQIWANLVPQLTCAPIFMKFSTRNKLNMQITNILLGIKDLDPKLQIYASLVPTLKCAPIL